MNIRAGNYDDKVSGEENSAVVLCTVRAVTATCLPARARQQPCGACTSVIATGGLWWWLSITILQCLIYLFVFFSVLPSLNEGTEEEWGEKRTRAEISTPRFWYLNRGKKRKEKERKAIKRDQNLHALALLEERAAGASVGSSVERSRDERRQSCVSSTYMWVVTSGTESLAFPTLNAKVSKEYDDAIVCFTVHKKHNIPMLTPLGQDSVPLFFDCFLFSQLFWSISINYPSSTHLRAGARLNYRNPFEICVLWGHRGAGRLRSKTTPTKSKKLRCLTAMIDVHECVMRAS